MADAGRARELLESRWRRFQAIALALDGLSSPEIAAITGLTRANVMQVCWRAGVSIAVPEPKRDKIDAAVMAVARGACAIDAAAEHGIAVQTLLRVAHERGIRSEHTSRGRKDGRSLRAARDVLAEGVSVATAAARHNVSTAAVHGTLDRVRETLAARIRGPR